jgi:hypothetical protein
MVAVMTIKISDETLIARLRSATAGTQLETVEGALIGTFLPENWGKPPAGFVPPLCDEELEERARTFDGRPLAEFMAELESRG